MNPTATMQIQVEVVNSFTCINIIESLQRYTEPVNVVVFFLKLTSFSTFHSSVKALYEC